jgi:hypothetical protein
MDIEGYEKLALKGLQKTLRKHRPIVEFELSTDPKSSVSIKSKEELLALFPKDYEFLVFRYDPIHRVSGTYILEPIGDLIHFDLAGQRDIVAYPVEKKKYIALKGSGTGRKTKADSLATDLPSHFVSDRPLTELTEPEYLGIACRALPSPNQSYFYSNCFSEHVPIIAEHSLSHFVSYLSIQLHTGNPAASN